MPRNQEGRGEGETATTLTAWWAAEQAQQQQPAASRGTDARQQRDQGKLCGGIGREERRGWGEGGGSWGTKGSEG